MARPRKLTEDFRLRVRKSDGIWEVTWTDISDPRRTVRRKSTGTRDRSEAERLFPQIIADLKRPKPPANETVGWIIDTYLKYIKPVKTAKQFAPLKAALSPVKDRLGPLRPDQVIQPVINDYVDWRRTNIAWGDHPNMKANPQRKISDSTIAKELRMLRAAMNYMVSDHGRKDLAPVFAIKVSEALPREEWLSRAEVQRMLDCCEKGNRDHIELFILISVATAARKEAVLTLTWDQITIGSYSKPMLIDFGAGSGNKRRPKIPVPSNFRLWTLLTLPKKHRHYVITYRGEPIEDVKDGFANVLRDAGIKDKRVTPHNMKHTAITLMLQRGIPVETVSMWTNTSEKIIRRVYGHHIPEHHDALAEAVAF